MGYQPKNAIETAMLPQDTILDGVITQIADGKVKEFVKDTTNWKGDINQPAINITMEVTANDKKVDLDQLFTYTEKDGKTAYTPRSNLGKYKKKYNKLPEPGDKVKISTNSEGFGKIKLD